MATLRRSSLVAMAAGLESLAVCVTGMREFSFVRGLESVTGSGDRF
jgi:hypothetical protein